MQKMYSTELVATSNKEMDFHIKKDTIFSLIHFCSILYFAIHEHSNDIGVFCKYAATEDYYYT